MPSVSNASQRVQVLQVLGNAIVGGMETYVSRLIERLPADQFGITVLLPWESELSDHLRSLGAEVAILTFEGVGRAPLPTNPVTPGVLRTTYQLSSSRSMRM